MPLKQNTILGISLGTRTTGYAIISNGELIDWGEKYFKGKRSKDSEIKFNKFLVKLLKDYQVTRIALKRINPTKSSPGLDRLYLLTKSTVRRYHLEFNSVANKEIKKRFKAVRNMQQLTSLITSRFPELNIYTVGNKKHYKLIEAITQLFILDT